jgi:hypothetical protein
MLQTYFLTLYILEHLFVKVYQKTQLMNDLPVLIQLSEVSAIVVLDSFCDLSNKFKPTFLLLSNFEKSPNVYSSPYINKLTFDLEKMFRKLQKRLLINKPFALLSKILSEQRFRLLLMFHTHAWGARRGGEGGSCPLGRPKIECF